MSAFTEIKLTWNISTLGKSLGFDAATMKKIPTWKRDQLLTEAGRAVAAGVLNVVPDYPFASGKPRPAIYATFTRAVWRKRKDGTRVLVRPPMNIMSKWKTGRQQRWFFWALANKLIDVPYNRTGSLGKSITGEIASTGVDDKGGVIIVRYGTVIHYAKYVIGNPKEQARYHQGTWWQLESTVKAKAPVIYQMAHNAIVRNLRNYVDLNG